MNPDPKHPNNMNADELRALLHEITWAALDLAQHLAFINVDEQATKMAYEWAFWDTHGPQLERTNPPGLTVFGAKGLEL